MNHTQKDYIMRMIEQFFDALAKIVHSRLHSNIDKAWEQIQVASQKYLNSDITYFLQLTPSQLLAFFKTGSSLDAEKAIVCADLLLEVCALCKQGIDNSKDDLKLAQIKVLALNLYASAIPEDDFFQGVEYFKKVETLVAELEFSSLQDDVKSNLSTYQNGIRTKTLSKFIDPAIFPNL